MSRMCGGVGVGRGGRIDTEVGCSSQPKVQAAMCVPGVFSLTQEGPGVVEEWRGMALDVCLLVWVFGRRVVECLVVAMVLEGKGAREQVLDDRERVSETKRAQCRELGTVL